MAKSKNFEIHSPDGIPIENKGGYYTFNKAKTAFDKWVKRFEKQGYYSSNNGRIPLNELEENCLLIQL